MTNRFARAVAASIVAAATLLTGTLSAFAVTSIGTDISTDGALSVSGNAVFDTDTLFVNASANHVGIGNAAPASRLTVGSGTSTFEVNSAGNIRKINNVVYSWPASQGGATTYLQNDGSGTLSWAAVTAGVSTLNAAYLGATGSPEISITPSVGALTIADTLSGTGNVFEVTDRTTAGGDWSRRYFTVSATAVGISANVPTATLHVRHTTDNSGTAMRVTSFGGTDLFTVDHQGNIVGDRSITISRTAQLAAAADEFWPNPGLAIIPSSTFAQDLIQTKTGSTFRFVVKNTGFVGVMTSTPSAEIDVRDTSASPTTNIFQVANLNDSTRYFTVSSTSTSIQTDLNLENGTGSVTTNAVTINAVAGVITDTTDINTDVTRAAITLTNSRITSTSVVTATMCSTPDTNAMLVAAVTPGSGSATVTVRNVGTGNQTATWSLCFMVVN